jgi:hypothetical protein
MTRDYEALAAELGVEDTPDWRVSVDQMFHPDNILKLYVYAAVKALGKDNNLYFEIPDDLTLPEDGEVSFGFNHVGTYATITVLEGEAREAIVNPGGGEPTPEHAPVREERIGEDPHRTDVSEPSPGGHGRRIPDSNS